MAEILQRCRTANCPNRQVATLCADHGGPKGTAKAAPRKRPAAKGKTAKPASKPAAPA